MIRNKVVAQKSFYDKRFGEIKLEITDNGEEYAEFEVDMDYITFIAKYQRQGGWNQERSKEMAQNYDHSQFTSILCFAIPVDELQEVNIKKTFTRKEKDGRIVQYAFVCYDGQHRYNCYVYMGNTKIKAKIGFYLTDERKEESFAGVYGSANTIQSKATTVIKRRIQTENMNFVEVRANNILKAKGFGTSAGKHFVEVFKAKEKDGKTDELISILDFYKNTFSTDKELSINMLKVFCKLHEKNELILDRNRLKNVVGNDRSKFTSTIADASISGIYKHIVVLYNKRLSASSRIK